MNIQDFIDGMFFAKDEFSIQNGYDRVKGVCISNNTLEWYKTKGLDIHYELQKNNRGALYMRLDCHIFPYWTIKGRSDKNYLESVYKYYSEVQTKRILDYRKKIFDKYYKKKEDSRIDYPQRKGIRYLWLAKYIIPSDCTREQLQAEVWKFIAQTYPQLIQILKCIDI